MAADLAILAMLQSLLGGSTAQEERFLLNELARRLVLSGLAVSNTGVFSFTVPFLDASALTGVVGVTHGGTGLATVAVNRILYASAADVVAALPSAANAMLVTNGSGVPAISATLPSGLTYTAPIFSGSIGSDLLFTDATYDIGKSLATRPRDLFLSRNLTVGGNSILGTVVADVLFTDGLYDIGKSAATRPRDLFLSRNLTVGGTSALADATVSTTLAVTGAATFSSTFITPKIFAGVCQGRLTLTTATPVTTADVTGATNVFWTPYAGNAIALYNGSTSWTLLAFVETTLPLGTLTNDLPYDVFAFNNAGTLNLEALAWTNKTTRATALVLQDGVLVKSGATTRRYLGTFHTTATTTTEDSLRRRLLWNYYNRVPRSMLRQDPTATWNSVGAGAYERANASATNQLEVVVGVAEVPIEVFVHGLFNNATNGSFAGVNIGEDSATVASASAVGSFCQQNTTVNVLLNITASLRKFPAVGYHFYSWLQYTSGGTATYYGFNAAAAYEICGMHGMISG